MLVGLGSAVVIKRKAQKLAKDIVGNNIMTRKEFNQMVDRLLKEGKKVESQMKKSVDAQTKKTINDVTKLANQQISNLKNRLKKMQGK